RAQPPAHRADRLFGRGRRDAACGSPAAQRPVAARLARTAHGGGGTGHSRSCAARPPRVRRPLRQRVTGSWGTVTGKRREHDLLITSDDASPVAGTLPCAARTPPGIHQGSWPAVRVNSV